MRRNRSLDRWSPVFTYSSPDAFLKSNVEPGLHSVCVNDQNLDVLVEDRGSSTTIVMFHSALTKRAKTTPSLAGSTLANDTEMNLVSIADPTIEIGDIDLAWYLGNKEIGELPPLLSPLIQHALEALRTDRVILVGASGGGYAAARFGYFFPDSIVLAINPRLDLTARPQASLEKYLEVAHPLDQKNSTQDTRDEMVPPRIKDFYEGPLPFDLCIYQNMADKLFLVFQVLPYLRTVKDDPRVFVRSQFDGIGHKPIPKQTLRGIIKTFASAADQHEAVLSAGFLPVKESSR